MVTAEDVLTSIGSTAALADVEKLWDDSMAAYPGAENIPFLQDDAIISNRKATGFGDEMDGPFLRAAAAIRADDALARLSWHCFWRVFLSDKGVYPPSGWPEPESLGEDRGLIYLLPAIGYVPLVRENHRRLGFAEDVTTDTVAQVRHYCDDNFRRGHGGRPGIYLNQLGWMRYYTTDPYVRIGRLEFWLQPSSRDIYVYRNRKTGKTVAFPPAGVTYLMDGNRLGKPEEYEGHETFTSKLEYKDGCVVGTPLSPKGYAIKEEISLPLEDWEMVFSKGDMSLGMHIPSGGGMDFEKCADSLKRAKAFFLKHFPDTPPKAVVCSSWIFNTQLQEIFPPEVNLCRFQRGLYLVPCASSPGEGLWFIFLRGWPLDFATAPRETTLQKKILDYLAEGHRWRGGQMFILMDDIDNFRDGTYLD